MASRRSSRQARRDSAAPYSTATKADDDDDDAIALTVAVPPTRPPTQLTGSSGLEYVLGDRLGEGAFATVYLATCRSDGQRYAIKAVDKDHTDVAEATKELNLLQRLGTHKHIVGMSDFFELPAAYVLVLELAGGGEVFERIADGGPFSEADAASVVRQVALGLRHVHGLGVVHRDLKPENLLMTSHAADAHVKIADFGLASLVGQPVTDSHGLVPGTPCYMAPELFARADGAEAKELAVASPALDVFSVGVILFNLLAGYQPFDPHGNAHEHEQRRRIVAGEWSFDAFPARWEHVSEAAREMVRGMLRTSAAERLSCAQILAAAWVTREAEGGASAAPIPGAELSLREFNDVNSTWRAAVTAAALVFRCPAAVHHHAADGDGDGDGDGEGGGGAAAAEPCGSDGAAAEPNAAAAAAAALPAAAKKELLASFNSLDTDHSGALELPELKRLVLKLGAHESQAAQLLKSFDTDGDGEIGFDDFCRAVAPLYSASSLQLRAAFDLFDTDRSGYIEHDEMAAMLSKLRLPNEAPVTEAQIKRLLDEVDTDHDGKVSFAEFLKYFAHI